MHQNLHNVRKLTFFDSMVWYGASAGAGAGAGASFGSDILLKDTM